MIDKLAMYLQYPFVRYAIIVGVLIALCSSLLGVTLVLKRFSFIGDGLSHVAFGAISIAAVMNLTNEMLLVLPVTIGSAILLLRTGQNAKIKGDTAIAMISVSALAFGYLLMNIFSTSSNLTGDVCSTLFGSTSILTLTQTEVWLCVVLSIAVVAVFVLFYNRIFAITFDETFSGNQHRRIQPAGRSRDRGDHRSGDEPGGVTPDLSARDLPRDVRHADLREFQVRHNLLGGAVSDMRAGRAPDLDPGGHTGGIHHRRRRCSCLCRMLCSRRTKRRHQKIFLTHLNLRLV